MGNRFPTKKKRIEQDNWGTPEPHDISRRNEERLRAAQAKAEAKRSPVRVEDVVMTEPSPDPVMESEPVIEQPEPVPGDDQPLVCGKCGKMYKSEFYFKRHVKNCKG